MLKHHVMFSHFARRNRDNLLSGRFRLECQFKAIFALFLCYILLEKLGDWIPIPTQLTHRDAQTNSFKGFGMSWFLVYGRLTYRQPLSALYVESDLTPSNSTTLSSHSFYLNAAL